MKYNKLEYNSSLFLSSISLFLGIGISKIINTSMQDSWISIILGTVLGLLLIKLFTTLPQKENKILKYTYSSIILTINLLLVTKLISSIYLNKTPDILVIIPLIILIYYTTSKDINLILKLSQIMCLIFILFALFPTITLTPKIDIDYFKPILTTNIKNIITSSIDYALISTSPYILYPNLKQNYNYKTYLLSSLMIFIIITTTIGNLGINLAKLYRYPEYMIFKEISILGFIENIQNILSFLWLFASYTLSSITAFNIKQTTNKKYYIITLILITLLLTNILLNNYIYTEYLTKHYGIILLLTIILYLISKTWHTDICLLLYTTKKREIEWIKKD